MDHHIAIMCGRAIQSSAPIRYAIVDGIDVHDSRVHNYPPRWNGAPSQDLLVIRRNRQTAEVSLDPLRWGLIPYWCGDPKGGRKPINAKCETVLMSTFHDLKFAEMRNGFARAVYVLIATKNSWTEFWGAATPRYRAAAAVQRLLSPGWRIMFLGWRLSPAKAAALKMLSNSVRKLVSSTAIDRGLLLVR